MPKKIKERKMTEQEQSLATDNMYLVPFILRENYGFRKILGDQAESIAYLALCLAAQRFDPERGVKFKTYAHRYIWGHLMSSIPRDQVVRFPNYAAYDETILYRLDDVQREFFLTGKPAPKYAQEFDTVTAIKAALSLLPESQQEVIRRRMFREETYEVIARDLGISKQAVNFRYFNGTKSLKRLLIVTANGARLRPDAEQIAADMNIRSASAMAGYNQRRTAEAVSETNEVAV